MILQFVKVEKALFTNFFDEICRQKDLSLDLELSHNVERLENAYKCISEITVCSNEEKFLNISFESELSAEDTDPTEEIQVHQETIDLVYPNIRSMIVSMMAAAMLQPVFLPMMPPRLQPNITKE